MQIVIEIPEDKYKSIVEMYDTFPSEMKEWGLEAIKNGIPQESEIIQCYQCKYAEVADPEGSQDGYTCQFHRGSIWFSGSYCSWAEIKTQKMEDKE